ncbi:MAG: Flp family type IVb pilin, partial [Oscillospiraceae bacterium]
CTGPAQRQPGYRQVNATGKFLLLTYQRPIVKSLFTRVSDESAVTAIEYALLAGLIAAVLVVTITLLGDQVKLLFVYVKDQVVLALS